jgi:histidinol-phosphatase (PHP family)
VIRFDHHTHHDRCGHALGSIEEYVRAALALGMEEIGITDHAPIYWMDGDHALPGSAMARSTLPEYVDEVLGIRKRYEGRIRVLLGLEVDFAEGLEDAYREALSPYPFDYFIGSVHQCLGCHIYHAGRWREDPDPSEVYAEYYRLIRASARSGMFDVLGHISGIMAYGPQTCPGLEREFIETATVLAETGVAIEVNASGIRKGTGAPFPHPDLLRRCIEAGVPVTYGSDAHLPAEVGHARASVAAILEGARTWRPASQRETAEAAAKG